MCAKRKNILHRVLQLSHFVIFHFSVILMTEGVVNLNYTAKHCENWKTKDIWQSNSYVNEEKIVSEKISSENII